MYASTMPALLRPPAQPNKTFCSRFICEVLQVGGVEAFQVHPLLSSCCPLGPRQKYLQSRLDWVLCDGSGRAYAVE